MRPQSYAYLAFSQGAHGKSLGVKVEANPALNFCAYADRDGDGTLYLTLINKSYGDKAQEASVALQLPISTTAGTWQRLDLAQKDNDIAAMNVITLGDAPIDPRGMWAGRWKPLASDRAGTAAVPVAPTSATILRLTPGVKSP